MKKTKGFLVINLKRGQSIQVGNDVEVYLSKASGNRGSIAIRAPKHIKIKRKDKGSKEVAGDKKDVTESNSTTSGQGIQGAELVQQNPGPLFI